MTQTSSATIQVANFSTETAMMKSPLVRSDYDTMIINPDFGTGALKWKMTIRSLRMMMMTTTHDGDSTGDVDNTIIEVAIADGKRV